MKNSIYEEYMRSVLGYQPVRYENTYKMDIATMNFGQIKELEGCYPDIYKIVYPMVQKVCKQNTQFITKELIDDMVNEVCLAVGDDGLKGDDGFKNEKNEKNERSENKQTRRNTNLNDLVRILILRELLGNPQRPPVRPQYPQMRTQTVKDMKIL